MILRKIKLFIKEQRGFFLTEMLASLAIAAIIGLGATFAIAQVMNQTTRNNDYTTASRHTLNAIQWISRDYQMAQNQQYQHEDKGLARLIGYESGADRFYHLFHSVIPVFTAWVWKQSRIPWLHRRL